MKSTSPLLSLPAALALGALCLGAPAFAQAPPEDLPPMDLGPPEPADSPPAKATQKTRRVRITLASGKVVEGQLLSHRGSYRVKTRDRELSLSEDQVKKVEFLPDTVNVDADDQPLREVMNSIARQSGRTIGVAPGAGDERVTVNLRQIPWRDAVYVIARMTGCQVEEVGESLYLSQSAKVTLSFTNGELRSVLLLAGAYAGRNVVLAPQVRGPISCDLKEVEFAKALEALAFACSFELSSKNGGVISARPLKKRPAPPRPRWLPFPQPRPQGAPAPKRVSLDFNKVSLEDAAEQVGILAQRNVLVGPGTKALVNLSLQNAPWPEAVQLLARQAGCRARTQAGIVLLEQPPQNALSAKNVPAAAWFRALAMVRGKNLIVAPEVNGLLEVNLAQAFLDDAFEQSARAYGYRVAEFGDITVVVGERYDPDAKPTGVRVQETKPSVAATPSPAPKPTPKQAKDAKKKLDEVMKEIGRLAEKHDVEGLGAKMQELDQLLREGLATASLTPAHVERYKQHLARYGELVHALQLQVYVQEGNLHLRAMSKAIEDKEPRKALVHQAQLEQLTAEMRSQEPEVFKRNADALAKRGRELANKALGDAGLVRTPDGPHRLYLESILWSDRSAGANSVCVILGQVYGPGDTYFLPSGEELVGVKVKGIEKDHVLIDVRGQELRLELE